MADEPTADGIEAERQKLTALQKTTQNMAVEIAKEALNAMMQMGWRWDATIETVEEDGKKFHEAKLVLRGVTLEEWEAVQKEQFKKQFLP